MRKTLAGEELREPILKQFPHSLAGKRGRISVESEYGILDTMKPRDIVVSVISSWTNLGKLADFAEQGRSYGNSDGGFGVNYAHSLDDYDRELDGIKIGDGNMLFYAFWGHPEGYEAEVTELEYLEILASELKSRGLTKESLQVQNLILQKTSH